MPIFRRTINANVTTYLSKSDYLKFRIHPAYLWLAKYKPRSLPPVTLDDEFRFEQGRRFEAAVLGQYKDLVRIDGNPGHFARLIDQTQHALHNGTQRLAQAAFMTDTRLFCRPDLLEQTAKGWVLTEIKSSTRVKENHIFDVAFQKYVLEALGLTVASCKVVYVNRNYVRQGKIDPARLATSRDISQEVAAVTGQVKREIRQAQAILGQPEVDDHPVYAGNLGDWLSIYRYLHPDINADSILNLASLSPQLLRQEYQAGCERISCIPLSSPKYKLSARQRYQISATKQQKPHINHQKIKQFLASLEYPLYFLDYETASYALPLYDNTRPYQQVPFQYSLHILTKPGGKLEHREYLHQANSLPAAELSQKLLDEISSQGTLLAWYDRFEKQCNQTLGQLAPAFAEAFVAINRRMQDLRLPFANNWYVDHRFLGSTSIKNVLPVLVPEFSYKNLAIQEGGAAQRLWQQVVFDKNPQLKAAQVFDDLRAYCRLDTLAMVKIFNVLEAICASDPKGQAVNNQVQLF